MRKWTFTNNFWLAVFFLTLVGCHKEADSLEPAAGQKLNNSELASDIPLTINWYNTAREEAGEAGRYMPTELMWEQTRAGNYGAEELEVVPLPEPTELFTENAYKGYRRLVIARSVEGVRTGTIIEILRKGEALGPEEVHELFVQAYSLSRNGEQTMPENFSGFVWNYNVRYDYVSGTSHTNGTMSSRSSQPFFEAAQPSELSVTTIACIDWYNASDWSYITTTCTTSTSGGGLPATGGGGWGGSTTGPIGAGGSSGAGASTSVGLVKQMQFNKVALLQDPCPGAADITAWTALLGYQAPPTVLSKLNNLTQQEKNAVMAPKGYYYGQPVNWQIQAIQNAAGIAINLDYFSVNVQRLPSINGQQLTADQFLNYIRLNMDAFVDNSLSTFSPHPSLPGEAGIWQSSNPLGAIISIGIPIDPGSVITSAYSPRSWVFSTITDPYNGAHPVSGNRTFGYTQLPSGGYTFYTRGTDRINYRAAELAGYIRNVSTTTPFQFTQADLLWTSFQNKIKKFVGDNGGQAVVVAPTTVRPNWSAVKTALQTNRPIVIRCD